MVSLSHEMDVKGKEVPTTSTFLLKQIDMSCFGNEQSGQRRRLTCRNCKTDVVSKQ